MRCRQHRLQPFFYLPNAGFTTHLHQLSFRPIQQEVVAHRRELQPTHFRLAMHLEKIRVLPALPGTFCVGFHIFYHSVQLPLVCQHTIERRRVIQVLSKPQLACLLLASLHISSDYLPDATGHCPLHLKHYVMMIRHHLVCQNLDLRTQLQ